MRRTAIIIAAAASLALLPACTDQSEPSPMPTSEDALTTATEEPEDAAVTSEPVETEDETEEPAAEGPPEMPAEAAANEAVANYVTTLSNVHLGEAAIEELTVLATDSCATCDNFESAAGQNPLGQEYIRLISSDAVVSGGSARVRSQIEQVDGAKRLDTIFELVEGDGGWLVDEILLSAN
ncbi:hypothetical protein [uncultured Serinicoccus sp.]|uniref:hypothetical protein n=1 Tax=uncultured Serinicoccus sp. TaxID=735514 RepID=UPI00260A3753|nr:hypothetical protein [uncultured Serinicoccus sp.]